MVVVGWCTVTTPLFVTPTYVYALPPATFLPSRPTHILHTLRLHTFAHLALPHPHTPPHPSHTYPHPTPPLPTRWLPTPCQFDAAPRTHTLAYPYSTPPFPGFQCILGSCLLYNYHIFLFFTGAGAYASCFCLSGFLVVHAILRYTFRSFCV